MTVESGCYLGIAPTAGAKPTLSGGSLNELNNQDMDM